ncbi:hypothetical protein POM88_007367 [Heracleum sosnowskyi]|uniref:Uncharacterized protein n=1 Tax=Heracleum sosnowskyi TaxID=360622 RepID=A0AAD8N5I4_9APIA|nr:hypothetical protein POM88_007367 [Heracleum sosnowskyi]
MTNSSSYVLFLYLWKAIMPYSQETIGQLAKFSDFNLSVGYKIVKAAEALSHSCSLLFFGISSTPKFEFEDFKCSSKRQWLQVVSSVAISEQRLFLITFIFIIKTPANVPWFWGVEDHIVEVSPSKAFLNDRQSVKLVASKR